MLENILISLILSFICYVGNITSIDSSASRQVFLNNGEICMDRALIGSTPQDWISTNDTKAIITRYTFDWSNTGKCQPIKFKLGQKYGRNIFDKSVSCKRNCHSSQKSQCGDPRSTKCLDSSVSGDYSTIGYFFSQSLGHCVKFSSKNTDECLQKSHWSDLSECNKYCSNQNAVENRCLATVSLSTVPIPSNPAEGAKWFYWWKLDRCLPYSSLPHSNVTSTSLRKDNSQGQMEAEKLITEGRNLFDTLEDCLVTCNVRSIQDVCSQSKDEGIGTFIYLRYFYNIKLGSCQHFIYRGSNGNYNRFVSLQECEEACSGVKPRGSSDNSSSSSSSGSSSGSSSWSSSSSEQDQGDSSGSSASRRVSVSRYPQLVPQTNVSALLTPLESDYCYDHPINMQQSRQFIGYSNIQSLQRGEDLKKAPASISLYFYYDWSTAKCKTFHWWTHSIGLSKNAFVSQDLCNQICTNRISGFFNRISFRTASSHKRCHISSNNASSSSPSCYPTTRWVIDPANQRSCQPTSICQSESIKYHSSQSQCLKHCLPPLPRLKDVFDKCQVPAKLSFSIIQSHQCQAPYPVRWVYQQRDNECISIEPQTSACNQSYQLPSNQQLLTAVSFAHQWECLNACSPQEDPRSAICSLPLETNADLCRSGSSDAKPQVRYHYDPQVGECRAFVYGGCLGNKNSWETYNLCTNYCVGVRSSSLSIFSSSYSWTSLAMITTQLALSLLKHSLSSSA